MGLEKVLLVPLWFENAMGWFGGIRIFLPERARILSQNLLTLALWDMEEISARHCDWAVSFVRLLISILRVGMVGSAGFRALRLSRSSISIWISGLIVGSKFLRKPEGMVDLAVFSRILLKIPTAWSHLVLPKETATSFPSHPATIWLSVAYVQDSDI